jgi:hypothetical protein
MMDLIVSNAYFGTVSAGAAIALAVLMYFSVLEKKNDVLSRKSKLAREMRLAYNSIEKKARTTNGASEKVSHSAHY